MAKFYGVIGYAIQAETAPGVWTDQVVERSYRGDVLQNMNRWQSSEQVNDDFTIDNKLSIISDPFAYENFQHIKYIRWMGANWKVTKVEILRPRLILTTGGVYNGPTA